MKNTNGGVSILVKLQAEACNFTKINTPPWVFSRFLNCTNAIKSRNAQHIWVNKEMLKYSNKTLYEGIFTESHFVVSQIIVNIFSL